MRPHKITVFLIIFTGMVTVITAAKLRDKSNSAPYRQAPSTSQVQQEENYRRRKERERRFAPVDYEAPEPTEAEDRAKRKLKNNRYDKFGFAIEDPSPRIGEESVENHWQLNLEPIPAAQSDAILVGEVLSAGAHLSNDKTGVYSEFTVRIIEVIKDNDPSKLAPGLLIDVDRPGGFVRYLNGHRRMYSVLGQNMPEAGRQYVMFLTAPGQSPNYRLLTGYELGGGAASPLDDSNRMEVYRRGVDETTFLKTVRDAAKTP